MVPSHPHSPLARFDGAKDDGVHGILHETTEEDKGKELTLGGFKSPPHMDAKDTKLSPLHMIFNLKGFLVGKEYFKINHLLPPSFNLVQGSTLQGKSIVPMLVLKEFLLRCLEQFIVYIWMSILLVTMNVYLRKIVKETSIKIAL